MNPPELRYSREHEWVRLEDDGLAVVGITQFAVESLGDVVFLDLPEPGTQVGQNDKLGEVESVKAVSDIYAPVSGTVEERNEAVIDNPEMVNASPYGDGWLVKLRLADPSELDSLMTAQEYEAFLASQE